MGCKRLYQRSGDYISVQKFISTLRRIYQRSANYPLKPHKKTPKAAAPGDTIIKLKLTTLTIQKLQTPQS